MPPDVEQHQSTRDPAQPAYVFRGHRAHIHSVQIVRRNTCLLTGDADGWLVCWRLETKRPLAVWKAHDAAILGTAEWGPDKIITHGRDNTLRIWQLDSENASYSTVLPADGADTHRPKPWLLHSLPVNTLNFCAFAVCYRDHHVDAQQGQATSAFSPATSSESVYIAVPGVDDKKIEVYQFPDEKLICIVPRIDTSDTGMVMAVKLLHHPPSNNTLVVAGYESGFTAAHLIPRNHASIRKPTPDLAQTIYLSRPHTQPVLSVDALPDGSTYFTSSADAVIAAHRIPTLPPATATESAPTERPGTAEGISGVLSEDQQPGAALSATTPVAEGDVPSLTHDGSAPRVETIRNTTSSRAVQTEGSNPFPNDSLSTISSSNDSGPAFRPSGLSTLLSSAPPQPKPASSVIIPPATIQSPHKTINTKHAGQQSLRVRSDGRLLATGGWDSRVRIYSTKTLKEVAVLKWHKEGVYAVAFGDVLRQEDLDRERQAARERNAEKGAEVVKRETGLSKLQRQREEQMQLKHWVAAGAKDAKVSLWEVF